MGGRGYCHNGFYMPCRVKYFHSHAGVATSSIPLQSSSKAKFSFYSESSFLGRMTRVVCMSVGVARNDVPTGIYLIT